MIWVVLLLIWLIIICKHIETVVKDNNRILHEIKKTQFNDGRQFGLIKIKLNKLEKIVKK